MFGPVRQPSFWSPLCYYGELRVSHVADPLVIFWEYLLTFCHDGMCGAHEGHLLACEVHGAICVWTVEFDCCMLAKGNMIVLSDIFLIFAIISQDHERLITFPGCLLSLLIFLCLHRFVLCILFCYLS